MYSIGCEKERQNVRARVVVSQTGLRVDGRGEKMGTHVGTPRVFGDGHVVVVGHSVGRVVHDVLEDGSEPDGVVDLGLLLHDVQKKTKNKKQKTKSERDKDLSV